MAAASDGARVAGDTPRGYYAWTKRSPSRRKLRAQQLLTQITEVFEQSNGTYGSPSKTVERSMRKAYLRATQKRRCRTRRDSLNTLAPAPILLQRSFDVKQIFRVWVSDFTELPCRNGKAYAVAIKDLCSRRILGITVSYTMQTSTLMHALDQACRLRRRLPEDPLIFHSARGSQLNADRFRTELAKRNIQQSMSGVGNCYDNASMESFWPRMKCELSQYVLFDELEHARSTVYK